MSSLMIPKNWDGFFREFRCANCGSDAGYASRPRNFLEKYVARLVFLRTVRCGDCYRRSVRPISVPLREKRKAVVVDYELAITNLDATLRKEPPKETPQPPSKRARIA
jgi:ribosomal protein S27E